MLSDRSTSVDNLLLADYKYYPKTFYSNKSDIMFRSSNTGELSQSGNASEPARSEGYPCYNQRQLSTDRTNTRNSIHQRIRSIYRPRLNKENLYTTLARLLLQPQSTY